MQNCPLETTQVASVIQLPEPPAATAHILRMSDFVTKRNLYPNNGHC